MRLAEERRAGGGELRAVELRGRAGQREFFIRRRVTSRDIHIRQGADLLKRYRGRRRRGVDDPAADQATAHPLERDGAAGGRLVGAGQALQHLFYRIALYRESDVGRHLVAQGEQPLQRDPFAFGCRRNIEIAGRAAVEDRAAGEPLKLDLLIAQIGGRKVDAPLERVYRPFELRRERRDAALQKERLPLRLFLKLRAPVGELEILYVGRERHIFIGGGAVDGELPREDGIEDLPLPDLHGDMTGLQIPLRLQVADRYAFDDGVV